jgi:AGCS family alanine or glycine:cation symporter
MSFVDSILFMCAIVILGASIVISLKTGFIQFRALPYLAKSFFTRKKGECCAKTVLPHKALWTAMSTTVGLGTMISPVIAIRLGGPGALLGYFLCMLFGSAATFVEVASAVAHRKRFADGSISGGPMPYLEALISPKLATWYAVFCMTLMAAWSGAQANQLAAIMASPLMGSWAVPHALTGIVVAICVLILLVGGIKWIAEFSEKVVPVIFVIYIGACLWIIGHNLDRLPAVFSSIFSSCLTPQQFATGTIVGGIAESLRWGIFKGVHSTEAGLGTQTMPHSMAATQDPFAQGMLGMCSIFSAGLLAILGGIVALISGTWLDPALEVGITMVARSFQIYFPLCGNAIIIILAFKFAFGTILGNCFNGSCCFSYLTRGRYLRGYFLIVTVMTFVGAICKMTLFWATADLVIAAVAIPHVLSLVKIAWDGSMARKIAAQPVPA